MAFEIHPISPLWGTKTERDKRTGTAVYIVISDEDSTPAAAEAYAVTQTIGLIGDTYPGEPITSAFRCTSRDCKGSDGTRRKWMLTCEYDSTISYSANPLNDPMTFDYDGEDSDEEFFKDTASPAKYAQTTAYEPFPTLPKRESSIVTIDVSRNVPATASFAAFFPFANKINQGTVTIDGLTYADGQVRIKCPKLSAPKDRDGYAYKTLSFTVKARGDGWDQKYESRGTVYLDSGYPFPICGNDGAPIDTPWPLDASGGKKPNASDTGAEIVLKPYTRADLSPLFASTP